MGSQQPHTHILDRIGVCAEHSRVVRQGIDTCFEHSGMFAKVIYRQNAAIVKYFCDPPNFTPCPHGTQPWFFLDQLQATKRFFVKSFSFFSVQIDRPQIAWNCHTAVHESRIVAFFLRTARSFACCYSVDTWNGCKGYHQPNIWFNMTYV